MSYNKVSPLAATPQLKLLTDTSEMNTAGKSRVRSMSLGGGAASSFATGNPYAALHGIAEGEEEGSGPSPTSPGGSASQNSGLGGAVALTSPPRGIVTGTSRAAPQQGPSTPRRPAIAMASPRTPQGPSMAQRRAFNAGPTTPSRESSGRSARTKRPTIPQGPNEPSIVGIPEVQAVEEFAFRAGQLDHGRFREQLPASPFEPQYEDLWLEFYVLGKQHGGKPRSAATASPLSIRQNPAWTVLINPWTQDLQQPGGIYDEEWVRKMCCLSLDSMAALVAKVCKRGRWWKETVCDVPYPMRQAIMEFPDLKARYEALQKDAKEALAGDLPYGY